MTQFSMVFLKNAKMKQLYFSNLKSCGSKGTSRCGKSSGVSVYINPRQNIQYWLSYPQNTIAMKYLCFFALHHLNCKQQYKEAF
jgi:hypothetical protein